MFICGFPGELQRRDQRVRPGRPCGARPGWSFYYYYYYSYYTTTPTTIATTTTTTIATTTTTTTTATYTATSSSSTTTTNDDKNDDNNNDSRATISFAEVNPWPRNGLVQMGKLTWVTKSVSLSCKDPPKFSKSLSFLSAFRQLFVLPVFAYPFRGR